MSASLKYNDNNKYIRYKPSAEQLKQLMGDDTKETTFLDDECSICLEKLATDDYAILERCLHKYHEKCIQEWFKVSSYNSCPECNAISQTRIVVKNNEKLPLADLNMFPTKKTGETNSSQISKKKYQRITPSSSPSRTRNSPRSPSRTRNAPHGSSNSASNTCGCLIS